MTRRILPQRRASETFDLDFGGLSKAHTVTVGFYEDGSVGEIFINGGKSGEHLQAIARDAAVVLSLALQYGADLENIKNAITRDGQDDAQSIIGVVIDKLFLGATTEEGNDHERNERNHLDRQRPLSAPESPDSYPGG
jgi:hypothetical protein